MVFTWHNDAPASLKAVFIAGFTLGTATFVSSVWCFVAILVAKKLRRPRWLFRASLCIKDIGICFVMLVPNLLSQVWRRSDEVTHFNPYLSGVIITSISASIFTLLCSSVDRYHAVTRPFRYHIGELMPTAVSIILIFYCWMMGLISALGVVTDYSRQQRMSFGVLLQFVALESWQKALLLFGLTFVYCVSACLLALSLSRVAQQKRDSRLRLESGQEEPIRSRRNSPAIDACRELPSRRTTTRHIGSDSESEANQLFLKIEDPGIDLKKTKRRWSLRLTQKLSFFTPTSYRPSILRRIRDTWYLYVVVITWSLTFFTTLLPFYYLVIAGEHCEDLRNAAAQVSTNATIVTTSSVVGKGSISWLPLTSNAHCVVSGICDCLILSQGFICVLIYVFADDVFRPIFVRPVAVLLTPFQRCLRRRGSESTYNFDRRRTLSKNSNAMSVGL